MKKKKNYIDEYSRFLFIYRKRGRGTGIDKVVLRTINSATATTKRFLKLTARFLMPFCNIFNFYMVWYIKNTVIKTICRSTGKSLKDLISSSLPFWTYMYFLICCSVISSISFKHENVHLAKREV